jgi:GNAT superfamily N-acetyltransferase
MPDIEIKKLEYEHIGEIARMHINYLSTELKGKPGERLLQQYYHGIIYENGAVGYVGLIDGKCGGFVCGVWDSNILNHWMVTHYLFRLIFWTSLQIIISPKYFIYLIRRLLHLNSHIEVQGYELRPIVVEEQNRGTGLAGLLVDRLVDDAKIRGYCEIHLFVDRNNVVAQKFYTKRGFINKLSPSKTNNFLFEMKW